MYQLDWSPFHTNGSSIFYFDKINRQVHLHHQAMIDEPIYTTNIQNAVPIDILSGNQVNKNIFYVIE